MEEQINNIANNSANNAPSGTAESIPTVPSTSSATLYETHNDAQIGGSTALAAPNEPRQQPAWEVVMDARLNPAALPASCISQVPDTSPGQMSHDGHKPDLISRGAIAMDKAEHLFTIYKRRLDHYVYGILADHGTLSSVRAGSPLLTAAVMTVAALHTADPIYTTCYDEVLKEFATQSTSRNHTLDDVRGLCIGAFWLSDMSWTLSGTGESPYKQHCQN